MDEQKSSSRCVTMRRAQMLLLIFCSVTSIIVFSLKHQLLIESKGEEILSFIFNDKDHQASNPSEKTEKNICETRFYFGGPLFERPSRELTHMDRQKAVCLDEKVAPKISDCLVYSFGIQYDWYFEESMGGIGCQVVF